MLSFSLPASFSPDSVFRSCSPYSDKTSQKRQTRTDRQSQTSASILVLNLYKEGERLVVYLDAVWLLNLLIDACLLKLTACMMKREVHWIRLWSGAFFASLIVLMLFSPLAFLIDGPMGKLGFSILIIFIAFGFHKLSAFLQNLAAFYFAAFATGGGLFALHYFMQSESVYAKNQFLGTMSYGDPVSWILVVCGFPLLWLFSKRRIDHVVVRKWDQSLYAAVSLSVEGHVIQTKGIIDSGNKLRDPLSRLPVIFLSHDACKEKLPSALFEQEPLQDSDWIEHLPESWQRRLALIPYQAVDGNKRFIWAFRPDQLTLDHQRHRFVTNRVLVAPMRHTLSSENEFGCILHPDLLLKGKDVQSA